MNEHKVMLANAVPAVGELRKVPGFNPLRLLQKSRTPDGEETSTLPLRYKRLWFRLACPNGRLLLNPLRVTDQMAIYEAQVFLSKDEALPIANYTATKEKSGSGSHYIQDAQDEALETALDNAGFGIQLCEVSEDMASGVQHDSTAAQPAHQAEPAPPQDAYKAQESARTPAVQAGVVTAQPAQHVQEAQEPARAPAAQEEAVTTPLAQNAQEVQESVRVPAAQEDVTAPSAQNAQETPAPAPAPAAPTEPAPVQNAAIHVMTEGEGTAEEATSSEDTVPPKYTEDMSVDDIRQSMTVEEAGKVVVTFGICNGWTIEQVAAQRSASLKWYAYGDQANNILKAAALVMLSVKDQQKAG